MMKSFYGFIRAVLGALLGLAISLGLCWVAGESPIRILKILFESGFGSPYDFGMVLFYSAPLFLTGLAVAIPYRAGLFNIGAEGQLTVGAMATAAVAASGFHPASSWIAISVATSAGFLAGALWAALSGVLKAKRGSHEVITTIMMNFIAAGVTSYFCLYVFKDPSSAQAETSAIQEWFKIRPWAYFNGAPMGGLLLFLLALVVGIHFWLKRSVLGYELTAVGENEVASELYGISKTRIWITSMMLGGGIAGSVGMIEVLGNAHRFKMGFSSDYGFVGIAVALVARGNILGIIPAALLFGILQKGAASLDLETDKVTRDLSYLIQGFIILGVAAEGLWAGLERKIFKVGHSK
jgi:ABC-type uncharacterized transport system permease subunit